MTIRPSLAKNAAAENKGVRCQQIGVKKRGPNMKVFLEMCVKTKGQKRRHKTSEDMSENKRLIGFIEMLLITNIVSRFSHVLPGAPMGFSPQKCVLGTEKRHLSGLVRSSQGYPSPGCGRDRAKGARGRACLPGKARREIRSPGTPVGTDKRCWKTGFCECAGLQA